MKKNLMRTISIMLCTCILATSFLGCNDSKTQVEEKEKASASTVIFNDAGEYTTTLTSDELKLSDVTADLVSIVYEVFDADGYAKAVENTNGEKEVSKDEYYKENSVDITEVKANEDGTLTISFTDDKASENATDFYEIRIEKPKASVSLNVEKPEFTLTPNVNSVYAYDKSVCITLTLNDSTFDENISDKDINLYGSFSSLKVDSLSCSGKKLTMQLKGEIEKNASSGVYLDGFIGVDRSAVANAAQTTIVSVPVSTQAADFDVSTLNVAEDGTITVLMNVYDNTLLNSLTKNMVSFEKNFTVVSCAKINENQAAVIMTADGVKDRNSAAALLDGQTVKIGDTAFTAGFPAADFYPLFDYVEADGANLKFTIMLYASNGEFVALKKELVSLDGDFAGGKVVSVTKESATVAELVILVPANGNTAENLNMNGTVILNAGAMTNLWGELTTKPASFYRNYAQGSMGKGFPIAPGDGLTQNDLENIQSIVGGFGNTTFGTIGAIGSGLGSIGSTVVTVLEITGIIESEKAKLDKIINMMTEMDAKLDKIADMIQQNYEKDEKRHLYEKIDNFYKQLFVLGFHCQNSKSLFKDAEMALVYEYNKEHKLYDGVRLSEEQYKAVAAAAGLAAPDVEIPKVDASKDQWEQYNGEWEAYFAKIVPKAIEIDHEGVFSNLLEAYANVLSQLMSQGTSILYTFDEYMSYIYNFDTEAYDERAKFRLAIQGELVNAATVLGIYYAYSDPTPKAAAYKTNVMDIYKKAEQTFEQNKIASRTDEEIYCYTLGITLKREMIASNRLTSKNDKRFAIAKGNITFFKDTAGKGKVNYCTQVGDDKVVVDGKTIDLTKGAQNVVGSKITVTRDKKTVTYQFNGLADTFSDDNGRNMTKEEVDKFIRKIRNVYGDGKNVVIDALLKAGFVLPSELTYKNDAGWPENYFEGISYDYWRSKSDYYSRCITVDNKLSGKKMIGVRGVSHFMYYVLNFVMP